MSDILNPFSLFDTGAGLVSTFYNMWSNKKDREWRQDEADRNQANVDWDQRHTLRQFNYMNAQNELLRQREDNAMQRRVADLKAANLNPLLAADGNAAMAQLGASASRPPSEGSPVNNTMQHLQIQTELTRLQNETKLAHSQMVLNEANGRLADANADAVGSNAYWYSRDVILREALRSDQVSQWEREHGVNLRDIANKEALTRLSRAIEDRTARHEHRRLLNDLTNARANSMNAETNRRAQEVASSLGILQMEKIRRDLNLTTLHEVEGLIKIIIDGFNATRGTTVNPWSTETAPLPETPPIGFGTR